MNLPERPNVDQYMMGIAEAVKARANCRGSRVGALLVLEGRIVSTGYNGTPSDMTNCDEGGCERCSNPGRYESGTAYDICICVHAEQNALLAAARFGIAVEGAILYSTMRPCFGCTKELLQAQGQGRHVPARLAAPKPRTAHRVREATEPLPRRREGTARRAELISHPHNRPVPECGALSLSSRAKPRDLRRPPHNHAQPTGKPTPHLDTPGTPGDRGARDGPRIQHPL